ncbi:MAG: AIR carboxylase family protein [Verrucomicrobia bacterium]|nr:AIR carboxylase family protein [Verrucomicrobiota bacterium]
MEPIVSIVMGSKSDLDIMSETAKVLSDFGVSHELRVISAHRTPCGVLQPGQVTQLARRFVAT